MARTTVVLLLVLFACGYSGCRCNRRQPVVEQTSASASAVTSVEPAPSATVQPARSKDTRPELKWYGWMDDATRPVLETTDTLWDRFAHSPPPGYTGCGGEAESWSEWLRLLPLAAPGTAVRNYRGEIVVPGDDEHLAAVVAIDIGTRHVQQSAAASCACTPSGAGS